MSWKEYTGSSLDPQNAPTPHSQPARDKDGRPIKPEIISGKSSGGSSSRYAPRADCGSKITTGHKGGNAHR